MNQVNNSEYRKFNHISDCDYASGWDRYAKDYAGLLAPDTIYFLTKELMHATILDYVVKERPLVVLDLNCGTGNDFPFFLKQGWKVVGCDGSQGMLNLAHEKYEEAIMDGRIVLYEGMMESLDHTSFGETRFDLVFSVTGGYSYIDDEALTKVNSILKSYLKGDGIMITAHLNSFCLTDMLFNLTHLRLRPALIRLKQKLHIQIKGTSMRMYLRGPSILKKLTPEGLKLVRVLPLLSITPPYQTGYHPGKGFLGLLRKAEMKLRKIFLLAYIADQVITIYKRDR